jgi:DUF1009 family protein
MITGGHMVGLIAGQGQLPVLVARGMRSAGVRVCAVGLRDQFVAELPRECDDFATAGIAQLGRWCRLLKRWGVDEAVMVGAVSKARMHDPLRVFRQLPDWRAAILWYRRLRHDRRNAALLTAVAEELERAGVRLIDSTTYIPDQLATPGIMTETDPTAAQDADIAFAWPLLMQVVALDIGQSMAVRERDVIAVEAVEGTDAMIERAGQLCRRKGWVLLKTASANHDMRADVPTIGVATIERLAKAGAGCVALGAGRVIMIDKEKVLTAADKAGIAIVGVA